MTSNGTDRTANQVWNQPTPSLAEVASEPKEQEQKQEEARNWADHAAQALKSEPEPSDFEREIAALTQACNAYILRGDTALADLRDTRAENTDLRTALQNTRIELVAAQNAQTDVERSFMVWSEQYQADLAAFQEAVSAARNTRDDAMQELAEVNRELVATLQEYHDVLTARDALERDLDAAARDLKTAKDQSRRADNTIDQWRTAYDAKCDELKEMRADRDDAIDQRDEALSEIEKYREGYRTQATNHAQLTAELREGLMTIERLQFGERLARKALESITTTHNELGARHHALVAERDELRYELARADARVAELLTHHDTHHADHWWHFWHW